MGSRIYENKRFSVLGDSLSTLEGYSRPEYAAFYDTARKIEAKVYLPKDTWWGKVIDHFGGSLLVNNSVSGSTVCRHPTHEIPSYGCSDERTSSLSENGEAPDVIMVLLGTNDWGGGGVVTPYDETEEGQLWVFSVGYRVMLEKLKANYKNAEIWCFTLPVSTCKKRKSFSFPYRYAGRHIGEYCDVIRSICGELGCRLIDLYRFCPPYDTIDDFHPNAEGMQTIAGGVIELVEQSLGK